MSGLRLRFVIIGFNKSTSKCIRGNEIRHHINPKMRRRFRHRNISATLRTDIFLFPGFFLIFLYFRGFPIIFRIFQNTADFRDLDPNFFGGNPMGFGIPGFGIFSWDRISHEKSTSRRDFPEPLLLEFTRRLRSIYYSDKLSGRPLH